MKNLLLSGSALLLSLGMANAQGISATGAHDDFATTDIYVKDTGAGVYWWENSGATALTITRAGDGAMVVAATNAGGCKVAGCYPLFGLDFGKTNAGLPNEAPVTLDLSAGADITFDIENTVNKFTYIGIVLEDINGVQAKYEPNVSDVVSTTYDNTTDRKGLLGFTFGDPTDPTVNAKVRKTITVDLSSVSGKVGGLTAGIYDGCAQPANCPVTTYSIDASKIKTVLFMVNFGKDNIFLTEGANYKEDTFVDGAAITPYTGTFKIYDFKIGTNTPVGVNEALVGGSLKVYPNPAKDVLNVSFEAVGGANVSLADIYGRTVYTTYAGAGTSNITVNTSDLARGMYILNVASKNGRVVSKVRVNN